VFVNVQKHPVIQEHMVTFVCQVFLQPSKARKRPLCCSIWQWYVRYSRNSRAVFL